MKHDAAGVLSMGNSGKNANSSQFFFTFGPCPALDGKHVVFGRVVAGLDVLRAVEALAPPSGEAPTGPVKVAACGLFVDGETPVRGHWAPPSVDAHPNSPSVFVSPLVKVFVVGAPAAATKCASSLKDAGLDADVLSATSLDEALDCEDHHAVCFIAAAAAKSDLATKAADLAATRTWPCVTAKPGAAADALKEALSAPPLRGA